MQKRGRPSAASLDANVIPGGFGQRPDAPLDLGESEAAIWRETVSSEPPEFFSTTATRAMLADYCRHRASADMVSEVLRAFKPDWLKNAEGAKRYAGLLRMRDGETRAAADKATKLRLTNQSRYTPQAAGTASKNTAKGLRPWEI